MRKTVADGGTLYEAGRTYDESQFGPGKIKQYTQKGWIVQQMHEPEQKEHKGGYKTKEHKGPKQSKDYKKAGDAIAMIETLLGKDLDHFIEGETRKTVLAAFEKRNASHGS